jgi:hypothetical protein
VTIAWLNRLVCALGIVAAFGQTSNSAPPAAEQEEIQIETIRGGKREIWSNVKPQKPAPTEILPPARGPQAAPPSNDVSPPTLPGQRAEDVQVPTILPAHAPEKPLGVPHAKGTAKRAVFENKSAAPREIKPAPFSDASEAQQYQPSQDVGSGRGSPQAAPRTRLPEPVSQESSISPLLQGLFIVALAIIAPLVSIVSFFWLLGRHSRQYGPLFRLSAGSDATISGPFKASIEENAANVKHGRRLEDVQEGDGPAPARKPVGETFDVGPTFEEERQLREDMAHQQEEAILQHFFEENLRLLEQIEQAKQKNEESDPQS